MVPETQRFSLKRLYYPLFFIPVKTVWLLERDLYVNAQFLRANNCIRSYFPYL